MGDINVGYVPAAILHRNPGIDKYKFIDLLNEIIFEYNSARGLKEIYAPIEIESSVPYFHGGIFELADLLGLKNKYKGSLVCPNALSLIECNPGSDIDLGKLYIEPTIKKNKWFSQRYYLKKGSKIKKTREVKKKEFFFFQKPQIEEIYGDFEQGIKVKKINKCERDEKVQDKFIANIDYEEFIFIPIYEKFNSLEKLVAKYPERNPETCIEWEKEKGVFWPPCKPPTKSYIGWMQKKGKYFLQEENLKESDYTGIIITAEAIRKKAWGLFQYKGYMLTQRFLVENEDSFKVHQRAVIDFWLSKYAKEKGLTSSELLRFRAENFGKMHHTPLTDKEKQRIIDEEGPSIHYFSKLDSGGEKNLIISNPIGENPQEPPF